MTYSEATSSARRPAFGRNQNITYHKSSKTNIGPVSNIIIITVIICLMGLIYLTQVTKTYALGYKLDELTQRKDQLTSQNSNLELESAKLRSIEKVKSSQANATMNTVSPTVYAQ